MKAHRKCDEPTRRPFLHDLHALMTGHIGGNRRTKTPDLRPKNTLFVIPQQLVRMCIAIAAYVRCNCCVCASQLLRYRQNPLFIPPEAPFCLAVRVKSRGKNALFILQFLCSCPYRAQSWWGMPRIPGRGPGLIVAALSARLACDFPRSAPLFPFFNISISTFLSRVRQLIAPRRGNYY